MKTNNADPERSELLDVLDPETYEKTRTATRAEVHKNGLLHGTVRVWWVDDTGRAWFQRRSETKALWPGKYDPFATGHVDAGEDASSAAVREVLEETGIGIPVPALLARIPFPFRRPDGTLDNELASVFAVTGKNPPEPAPSDEVHSWAAAGLGDYARMISDGVPCPVEIYEFDTRKKGLVHTGTARLEAGDFCCPDASELMSVLGAFESRP